MKSFEAAKHTEKLFEIVDSGHGYHPLDIVRLYHASEVDAYREKVKALVDEFDEMLNHFPDSATLDKVDDDNMSGIRFVPPVLLFTIYHIRKYRAALAALESES